MIFTVSFSGTVDDSVVNGLLVVVTMVFKGLIGGWLVKGTIVVVAEMGCRG